MKNSIGILGSTGSIGRNTLNVVRNLNKNGFDCNISFLSTNCNTSILNEQIEEFKPDFVFIKDSSFAKDFKCSYEKTRILSGDDELVELIKSESYDILVNSFVGFAGLIPTMEAIKAGKRIALANKESLVVGGKLIYDLIKDSESEIIPIDSEHSAILQCLIGEDIESVDKIILTASGGPFRKFTQSELENVTIEQALNHPNWKMGKKITIDSATLMNKGLEVIEAKWLFDINHSRIDVVIHPQSVIHSMVEFSDGSVKAQLGVPDMKIPIQYAITYPERVKSDFQRLDFSQLKNLDFETPDLDKFKCLKFAFDIIKTDGTYAAVLNAANEIAVDLFLKGKIKFLQIADLIENALNSHKNLLNYNLNDLIEIDKTTRIKIQNKYY